MNASSIQFAYQIKVDNSHLKPQIIRTCVDYYACASLLKTALLKRKWNIEAIKSVKGKLGKYHLY
jgi:hypothetical protein